MQALDDIATLAQLSQALLCILGQHPARRTGGFGEAQPLERAHPPDPDLLQGIARNIAVGTKIDDPLRPSRFPGEHRSSRVQRSAVISASRPRRTSSSDRGPSSRVTRSPARARKPERYSPG